MWTWCWHGACAVALGLLAKFQGLGPQFWHWAYVGAQGLGLGGGSGFGAWGFWAQGSRPRGVGVRFSAPLCPPTAFTSGRPPLKPSPLLARYLPAVGSLRQRLTAAKALLPASSVEPAWFRCSCSCTCPCMGGRVRRQARLKGRAMGRPHPRYRGDEWAQLIEASTVLISRWAVIGGGGLDEGCAEEAGGGWDKEHRGKGLGVVSYV